MILAASPVNDAIETVMSPIADAVSSVVFFDIPIGENSSRSSSSGYSLDPSSSRSTWVSNSSAHSQKLSYHLIRGRFARETDPGEVTSFQALATELSGTVGLGNIAGVAIAITVGGPGAALWIAVAGLLGMSVKMAEATLGSKFRIVREDGTTDGGPMYYLRDGLKQQGHATLGKVLSVAFAVTTIFGMTGAGNMFQANQATSQIVSVSGGVFGTLPLGHRHRDRGSGSTRHFGRNHQNR
ncbi:MAG: alanine:cation symporter family protein [Lawsonella clevelandensis]